MKSNKNSPLIGRLISHARAEFKCEVARPALKANSAIVLPDAPSTENLKKISPTTNENIDIAKKQRLDPLIGTTIQKYQILDLLGVGGMAKVFKAKHLHTGKIHAFKILREHLSSNNTVVRRFQIEAMAASRVEHPNCIGVSDFGSWSQDNKPDLFYLVMDYAPGANLHSIIDEQKSSGGLTVQRALHILIQICEALNAVHKAGIIHRDIKPSNVILISKTDDQDFVKLADFGIAKIALEEGQAATLTATGEVFGSPFYMSPEQCKGEVLDKSSDIYSFGCLMYEILAGEPPFKGEVPLRTIMMQIEDSASPIQFDSSVNERIAEQLNELLQRLLSKEKSERPETMLELKFELVSIYEQLIDPSKLKRIGTPWSQSSLQKKFEKLFRSTRAKIAIATTAIILLAFLGFLTQELRHQRELRLFSLKAAEVDRYMSWNEPSLSQYATDQVAYLSREREIMEEGNKFRLFGGMATEAGVGNRLKLGTFYLHAGKYPEAARQFTIADELATKLRMADDLNYAALVAELKYDMALCAFKEQDFQSCLTDATESIKLVNPCAETKYDFFAFRAIAIWELIGAYSGESGR